MALTPGTILGSCEILDLLGKGGMGEVYRGRDTRLGRDVAVKALPDTFIHDADRIARFDREAQVLASLNHPNIAGIYSLEEFGGAKYLLLELVDGETLSERIDRGPIPLDEALEIAVQIAEALAAAHDKGVIHRDLKPPNIKITTNGKVKVLDFGLAKMHEGSGTGVVLSNSPTLSAIQSAAGVILGTAAYMSPEQARGRSVDKRADVWAFGCIVYEMLTGTMIFPNGETVSDTLAGILARDPKWEILPATTPPRLRALLQRCLSKDSRQRLQDIGDARIEIEDIRQSPAPAVVQQSRRREYVLGTLALLSFTVATVLALRSLRVVPVAAPVGVRFNIGPPEGASFIANSAPGAPKTPYPELSPDGKQVAFIASVGSKQQLWVRHMDSPAVQLLAGTEDALFPAWSPDSQNVAFVTADKVKKVSIAGGPTQILGSTDQVFGTSWGANNDILLGASSSGLGKIAASGGTLERATELDATRKETAHRFPHFLPDGIHFTFLAFGPQIETFIGSLDSRERKPLPGISSEAMYSAGHLVFVRADTLMAQAFDLDRMELKGDAFPIGQQISSNSRQAAFSVSPSGSLVYRTGIASSLTTRSRLDWFDPTGKPLGVAGPEGEYGNVDLSPDSRYVTFERGTPSDVWVLDLGRGVTSRMTTNAANDSFPVWSPDGKFIAFSSPRTGANGPNIYRHAFGVIGEDEPVVTSSSPKFPVGWSGNGEYFVYLTNGPQTASFDIWTLRTASGSKTEPLMETPFNETFTAISPDSHWIAYASNETGQYEVYVQSFPNLGPRQQVSTGGAIMPKWSADGKKLFYVSPASRINVVSIKSRGASLEFSPPEPLFQVPIVGGGNYIGGQARNFDVAADGRFLVKVAVGEQSAAPIEVIINWPSVLKK